MRQANWFGKTIRILAVILFGLTVVFSLMAGIGSTCVALGAEKFSSMAALIPYKWLYQILVILTLGAALYGAKALVDLVKNRKAAFKEAVMAIIACLIVAVAQVIASRMLRGKSMPNDLRVYISLAALLAFGLLRLPPVWRQSGMGAGGDSGALAAGLSLFISGVSILTVQWWAGPAHTWEGVNFADAWHTQLALLGWGLVVGSLWPLTKTLRSRQSEAELVTT
jgi:hypothetical protein